MSSRRGSALDDAMLSDDEPLLVEALQALQLLPGATTQAEPAFKRATGCIAAMEEGLRERNKNREGRELPMTLVPSLIRDRINAPEELGLDGPALKDVHTAFAICEIRDAVFDTKEAIREEQAAPRRSEVRDKLDFIATHGHDFADALETPYVIEALERELQSQPESEKTIGSSTLKKTGEEKGHDFWCTFEEPAELNVVAQDIRTAAVLAKQALERRKTLITREGLAYERANYADVGGAGKAYSVNNLPLKQGFVMRCLALFGKYRAGVASTVQDGPFANFARTVWVLATGEPESLAGAISDTLKDIRDPNASPALLAALLDLPEGTLPPQKTRR